MQTWLLPQLVPSGAGVAPAVQVGPPVHDDTVPSKQGLAVGWQGSLTAHGVQAPALQ
jgi:hypothetical protein